VKEYGGTDLQEIRLSLQEEGFSEVMEDRGEKGFDLWRPFDDLPATECLHVVVWLRDGEGEFAGKLPGYWVEEY